MDNPLLQLDSLLLLPLIVQSLSGYAWLSRYLGQQGGRVQTSSIGLPDLMVSTVLALGLIHIAVMSFQQPVTVEQLKDLKPIAILFGALPYAVVSCGIVGFLSFRGLRVREFFGLPQQRLGSVVLWAIALLALAVPGYLILGGQLSKYLPKGSHEEQAMVLLFRSMAKSGDVGGIASIGFVAALMAPLAEEVLFRGYFYPVGKRYFGAWPSAVLTSVVFALVHANLASFPALFLLALCLTVAYEFTGSLAVPIVMHGLYNGATLAALLYFSSTQP